MDVRETVLALAEPLAAERGLVLIDVEVAGSPGRCILRCVLDRPGGVTLDDCAGFHRAIDPLLDAADPVAGAYVLEVSSPGQERALRTERDFRLFSGRLVLLAARLEIAGRREWSGRLVGLEGDQVVVAFGEGEAERVAVAIADVAWARLRMAEPAGRRTGAHPARRLRRHAD